MQQEVSRRLERLRKDRARRSAAPIAGEVARLRTQLEQTGRRLAEVIAAWEEIVPQDLAAQTRIASYRGGVVHIIAASSGVLYEVDRLLRGGAEAALRQRVKGTVSSVKLRIGDVMSGEAPGRRESRRERMLREAGE